VCSGIEAASVAWHPLGWTPVAFAEIDRFPAAVLAHHYPSVPNWGDLTKFAEWPDACRCPDRSALHVTRREDDQQPRTGRGEWRSCGDGDRQDGRPGVHGQRAAASRGHSGGAVCAACGGTAIDVLVGGTPCQSFSVAGLRAGLADPRGNLALTYLAVADRYRPTWVVWENVPGVLSADDGRALGSFLGGLGQLGYGFAYRVLDAQHFGLAQRRARVFVVGHLGDWRRAAAVLFERESLSGHPAPRREAGQGTTSRAQCGFDVGGTLGPRISRLTTDECAQGAAIVASTGEISHCLNAGGMGRIDYETETLLAHSLRADGFDASEDGTGRGTPLTVTHSLTVCHGATEDGTGRGTPLVAETAPTLGQRMRGPIDSMFDGALIAFSAKDYGADAGELAPTLRAGGHTDSHANGGVMPAVAFDARQSDVLQYGEKTGPLDTDGHSMAVAFQSSQSGMRVGDAHPTLDSNNGSRRHHGALVGMQVRRLTPRECERLQGFPDDYTLIPYRGKPAADGPRYKALGNSMAVPVMSWIGRRIALVDALRLTA
jgi:DNA (cytosine-5)-methyltransferase 1